MTTVRVKRTCPWCHGSGQARDPKSTWEMLNGGLCGKCGGSGEVKETVDVPSSPRSTNSSSGDGSMGLAILAAFIVVVTLALFALALVFIFLPVLLGGCMLFTEWKKWAQWVKFAWVVSFFAVPGLFDSGWIGPLTALRYEWGWINFILPVYYPLGFVALGIVIVEIVVRRNKRSARSLR